MEQYSYIILGAGPSGLAFAHSLKRAGVDSFLVIEQNTIAGGLCRSEVVDGAPLDIGGGHFLDVKHEAVLDLLFTFLPKSEWREFRRNSKINIRGTAIDYPFEANLWQLPIADQVDFLDSIAKAGCVSGKNMPDSFEEWITWKLGDCIAEEYMLPYNRKIWSTDLNSLGTYWLYKLPDVSFRETLQSCLEGKPAGTLPAHGSFLYPKSYGYGEVWKRMGEALGDKLITSTPVTGIDVANRIINGSFQAQHIVTSIPWSLWPTMAEIPAEIETAIASLNHAAIDVDYHSNDLASDAHWIYCPDDLVSYHRILCRHNFCNEARGYWTETNARRAVAAGEWRFRNEYAYPLNTQGKPAAVAHILAWASHHGITGIGRWGTWEHMNSDAAVEAGMSMARKLMHEMEQA
jgi:Protoporphyrinogen oxidase